MSGFKKMMNALAGLEKLILVLTTAVTLVLVFGNVITRKVPALGIRLAFTEELVIALFVLISLLASALCCRDNSHISLALLSQQAAEAGHHCCLRRLLCSPHSAGLHLHDGSAGGRRPHLCTPLARVDFLLLRTYLRHLHDPAPHRGLP